jgi:nucleoside-diphosphate-sugar epimerase
MKIGVIGATGILGRNVVPRLLANGHAVRAIVRREAAVPRFAAIGAETALADIFDSDRLTAALEGCDAAINVATAVPRPGDPPEWDENSKVRVDGTRSFLHAATAANVTRVLHQSIAMINKSDDGAWVDEDAPYHAVPHTQSAVDLEALARASDLDWRIVRAALFYGPGTGRDDFVRRQARDGELKIPGDGHDYLSQIHISDLAAAVVAVLESPGERQIYLASDDEPATYKALYNYICALEGVPPPSSGGPVFLPSFRVRNEKLRSLGWTPHYPTYRCGIV